eukprot:COSAG01_NODE_5554_length_4186_cov_32.462931_7_plen_151_part_00
MTPCRSTGARFARVVRFIRGKHVVCDDKGCCCRFEQFKPGSIPAAGAPHTSRDGAATAAKPAAPGADAGAATVDAEATGKAQRKIAAARSNLGVAESVSNKPAALPLVWRAAVAVAVAPDMCGTCWHHAAMLEVGVVVATSCMLCTSWLV